MKISTQTKENHKSKNQNSKLLVNHMELLIDGHNRILQEREEINARIREKINEKNP